MKEKILLLIISIIYLYLEHIECLKRPEPNYNFDHKNRKIKHVTYAIKTSENVFKLNTVPVRHLEINGFKNWVAKAIWNGRDYNTTGYTLSLNVLNHL